jgi:flagellar hook-associated protein 3 FlgL
MRVTFNQLSRSGIWNINQSLERLVELREMVSTGRSFHTSSEDPVGAEKSVFLAKQGSLLDKLKSSAESGFIYVESMASDLLSVAESLREAKAIAISQVDATSDTNSREATAVAVKAIRDQLMLVMNHQMGNRYLYAGHMTTTEPFVETTNGVEYRGDSGEIRYRIGPDQYEVINIPGDQLLNFGSPVLNSNVVLRPNVALTTPLASLNDGAGIPAGRYELTDGDGNTVVLNTTGLTTVQDLFNQINRVPRFIQITARINSSGDGIELVEDDVGDTITVRDMDGGSTATALNLVGVHITSADSGNLQPILHNTSLISDIPMLSGALGQIQVYVDGVPTVVDFSLPPPVTTIGAMINRFNQTVPWVTLSLNDSQTGFVAESSRSFEITTAGADLTAAQLGLVGGGHGARLFGSLESLEQALRDDDTVMIEQAISELAGVLDGLVVVQGTVAGRLERIQTAQDLIARYRVDVETRLSDIQDVDLAETITWLSEAEILYEAALSTTSKIYNMSLLNYMKL